MNDLARHYIETARCPPTIPTGDFGLWKIERNCAANRITEKVIGFPHQTVLSRFTEATIHLERGEIIMEDGIVELSRHLPIWMRACGKVLVTGLGLGCVVRGLLANPAVDKITVVELDSHIIRAVWPEFCRDEKLMLLQNDALTMEWPPLMAWDYAWHDIWKEGTPEPVLHCRLFARYMDRCENQGAWGLPPEIKRKLKSLPWFFG